MDMSFSFQIARTPVQSRIPAPPVRDQAEAFWTTFVARSEAERACWQAVMWQGRCPCTLETPQGLPVPAIEQHLLRMAMALDEAHGMHTPPAAPPAAVSPGAPRFVGALRQALRHRRARCPACAALARGTQH